MKSQENGWIPSLIPSPLTDFESCGRHEKSTICDPDKILAHESKNAIQGYINDIISAEIGVLAIKKMDITYFHGIDEVQAAGQFARHARYSWSIGSKEKDDGILVFISTDDRVAFLSTGRGVETKINNPAIDGIIQHMRPYLRNKQYGTALERSVIEIKTLLTARSTPYLLQRLISDETFGSVTRAFDMFLLLFTLVPGVLLSVVIILDWAYFGKKRKEEVQRLMLGQSLLQRFVHEVQNVEVGSGASMATCVLCLRDFSQDSLHSFELNSERGACSHTSNLTFGAMYRPRSLECKHKFCLTCFSAHLKSPERNEFRCPICCSSCGQASSWQASCLDYYARNQMNSAWLAKAPEYHYQLNRMHTLYPEVVTEALLKAAIFYLNQGSITDLSRAIETRQLEVHNIITAKQRKSSSNSKSSKRSGGGGRRSRSSGGKGGRW